MQLRWLASNWFPPSAKARTFSSAFDLPSNVGPADYAARRTLDVQFEIRWG